MPPPPARCGTDAGYYRHRRTLKEQACPACCQAHADATRLRAAARRQPARLCPCGSPIRTHHDKCFACRRIDRQAPTDPGVTWSQHGGIWRAA